MSAGPAPLRARLALLAALALAGAGCRRRAASEAVRPGAPPPRPAVCDRLAIGEEPPLSSESDGAEGVALAVAPGGVLAAWLSHGEGGRASASLRLLDAEGRPRGAPRAVAELAPAPATAVIPAIGIDERGAYWLCTWDDRAGCGAVPIDPAGPRASGARRALGTGACFAPATEPGRGLSVVRADPGGWRAVPVAASPGAPAGPVLAPAGDRWIARARDGAIAYVADGALFVRGRDGAPRPPLARPDGAVVRLALQRAPFGYVLAWSEQGRAATSMQRLGEDLAPLGERESIGVGGGGVAITSVGDESWVATADAGGAIAVVRLARAERRAGLDAVRPAGINDIAIAPSAIGAVVAYAAIRPDRSPAVFALGARCAAGAAPRPR